jgi:hypothetical protein
MFLDFGESASDIGIEHEAVLQIDPGVERLSHEVCAALAGHPAFIARTPVGDT